MNSTRIARIDTITVQLPTRREHKWTGLTEPIGRYVLTPPDKDLLFLQPLSVSAPPWNSSTSAS